MTTVLERPKTKVLEPELMEALGLIQGHVADFDTDYHIHNFPLVMGCGNNPCSGMCGRACSDECEYNCYGSCTGGSR
jgi:hypothetical protein